MERDVLEKITQTVTGDPTMRALTGWSASDPRWYFYHRSAAVLDPNRPAYMTYLLTSSPETTMGVSANMLSVIIWGRTRSAVLDTRARLKTLLDKVTLTSGSGRKFRTRFVNEQDTYSEEADFVGRQIAIRAAYLG